MTTEYPYRRDRLSGPPPHPSDLRQQIAQIDRILLSGADTISVDGVSTKIDRDGLESERKRLGELYDRLYGRRNKPSVATINISGAF